jgi:GT2 family glycosyltransferase
MSRVTAVIPSHNGGDRLFRTVEALERQTLAPAQIIVVDDASDDGSTERLAERCPLVCLLRLPRNLGLSAARNAGLRHAASELVLLVDHDIYLEPDCIERLADGLQEGNAVAACPRIRLHPEREIIQADGAEPHFVGTLRLRHGWQKAEELRDRHAGEVPAVLGGCLLVQRTQVLEAGGFDEIIFFYFEDLELSVRLRGLGHRFVVVPSALAYHDRRAGAPGIAFRGKGNYPARRLQLTLRHRLLVLLVHYRVRTLLALAPALALYELASLAMAAGRGLAGEWLRAWGWQVGHASAILERRRRIQRQRVVPDRDILVGGPLPLAPGVVRSRPGAVAVDLLSASLDLYWRLARHFIG